MLLKGPHDNEVIRYVGGAAPKAAEAAAPAMPSPDEQPAASAVLASRRAILNRGLASLLWKTSAAAAQLAPRNPWRRAQTAEQISLRSDEKLKLASSAGAA